MPEVAVHHGDSREVLKTLADASIDSVVCDPPYALVSISKRFGKEGAAPAKAGKTGAYQRASAGFMGKAWDTGEAAFDPMFWAEVLRVLKPGGHVVAFGGTRTYHRLACAIEDAGFEIRDQIGWAYGSGFPKSHDVAKGIDKTLGVRGDKTPKGTEVRRIRPGADQHKSESWEKLDDRSYQPHAYRAASDRAASDRAAEWSGWGTALKPAWEPVAVGRKPLDGTVAANVLEHGCGALNIGACRVDGNPKAWGAHSESAGYRLHRRDNVAKPSEIGRWPANLVHDGSDEVVAAFPAEAGAFAAVRGTEPSAACSGHITRLRARVQTHHHGDAGSAARFFYTAKADAEDRMGSKHPTVKPVDLMAWLCRLVTPPGGVVLDPFAGTGTTGLGAMRGGFDCILIEREAEYVADIERRLAWARGEGRLTAQEISRPSPEAAAQPDDHELFSGAASVFGEAA